MIRSIRFALLGYFLLLLTLVLGIAFFLVYRTARATTLEKQAATEELLHAEYRDTCRQEEAHLDEALVFPARTIASLAQQAADSAQEQSQGLQQLSRSVGDLESVNQQNSALVEEVAAASASLRERAQALRTAMGRFRLQAEGDDVARAA